MGWQHFAHGADIGVRGVGESKSEAFEQAALALTAVVTDPSNVKGREAISIRCEAPDDELLLTEWLNTVIYEMAVRKMLFSRFEVAMESGALAAKAWGEAVDVRRHEPAVEVKGATFTALEVRETPNGQWLAQCVVDV